MKIIITKSPKSVKKWRAIFEDGKHVDFGAAGMSDYTIHKDPLRMRLYVNRHGGSVSKTTSIPRKVHTQMQSIKKSNKENWTKKGIRTAGFWSRWLTWSEPSLRKAVRRIERMFNVQISLK